MEIELFTLCNYAANNDGKLTIVDTLEAIEADKFPWRAYFGVALRMVITGQTYDSNVLTLRIVDEAGQSVIFETSTEIRHQPEGKFVLAGNLKGLKFDGPGVHHFKILMGEEEIKDYKFDVKLRNAK